MQGTLGDTLVVIIACLAVAIVASAVIHFRPARRRHRHRKRHSQRPKIDLFAEKSTESVPAADA